MPDATYIAIALAVAVAITVTLRAAPFAMKNAMQESALLAEIGRWMPSGGAILAVYCLTKIDITAPTHGIAELVGVAVTVAVHRWRRNLLLSIATGTAACIVLVNWALPG